MSTSSSEQLRPIQLLFRSKEAVELYTLPDTSSSSSSQCTNDDDDAPTKKGGITLYKGKTTFHLLNPNGQCAYIHDVNVGLIKCDFSNTSESSNSGEAAALSKQPFLQQESKSIQLAKCSPRGSYIVTWERPSTATATNNNNGNLKVWDASHGTFLHAYSCKKATLNTVQWTHDEKLLFHLVTNEIHIYDASSSSNFQKRVGKVRCSNVLSFSLPCVKGYPSSSNNSTTANEEGESNEKKYLLTVFVPGVKGKPARIDMLRYPDRMGRESSTVTTTTTEGAGSTEEDDKQEVAKNVPSGPALTSKSLFSAEEAIVQWSPRADSALITTQTSIDATGESYYGSSHLFLLLEKDVKRPGYGIVISVPLPGESTKTSQGTTPIVAVSWITNPQIVGPVPFGIISGRMPPLLSLHHGITGEPTFLFGKGHRNTLDVSPHGRFLVSGGYGNLAGGMDFWDRNKGKKIPRHVTLDGDKYVTIKDNDLSITSCNPVVGHQWSPDSRTYLVSTTSPRMNVDNGVNIYRYDGSLVNEKILPWDNSRYKPDKLLCAEYVPAPFPSEDEQDDDEGKSKKKNEFYYYPDRPQSPPPRKLTELKGDAAKVALSKLSSSQNKKNGDGGGTNTKPAVAAYVPPLGRKTAGGGGAYVPPGARKGGTGGGGGGSTLAERMRQEREGSAANVSGIKVTKRTGPVGASSVVTVGGGGGDGEKSKSAIRREKQRLAKEKAEREAAEAERRKLDEERARVEANKADPAKRAKKINKILKQIDEIKTKLASGVELNDDQKKKMDSEEELRKELASLGL